MTKFNESERRLYYFEDRDQKQGISYKVIKGSDVDESEAEVMKEYNIKLKQVQHGKRFDPNAYEKFEYYMTPIAYEEG